MHLGTFLHHDSLFGDPELTRTLETAIHAQRRLSYYVRKQRDYQVTFRWELVALKLLGPTVKQPQRYMLEQAIP